MADHRVPDGLAHHKTRPDRIGCGLGRVRGQRVDDEMTPACPGPPAKDDPEVFTPPQTCGNGQHGAPRRAGSGGQRAAALATASRQDGPARTSPHAQAETVDPGASSVVRLEGALTLAHCFSCVSAVGRRIFGRLPACRAVARQSLVSPTNVWPRHDERRHTWARETRPSLTGDLTRVRTPVESREGTPPPRTATGFRPEAPARPDTEWQHAVQREMLARDDALWQRAGLVSVPLSGHRTRCRRDHCQGVEAPEANVEPARGVAAGRRTLVHSCGQLCGYSLCPRAGRSKMTSEGEYRACWG
ncbi:hypothetical protein SAMN04489732_11850 [Amycolatopsis saalfeldensis]|uniref:Uncharacterized protein n=1 Tax=Amycolatopsis saalfeldensis TaxID=394193 RepID=A0A1H8YIH2_9PSEU|nr:hypothetical protein SAMN04489732_11850 [Amycolatopsis saalfeldensis]